MRTHAVVDDLVSYPWPGRSTVFQLTTVLKTDNPIAGEESEAVVKHKYNNAEGAASRVHSILNGQPACAREKAPGVQSHAELFSSPSLTVERKGAQDPVTACKSGTGPIRVMVLLFRIVLKVWEECHIF